MNQLYYGDNLEVMRKYIADESVDLCYIDPPFNSNADYNLLFNTNDNKDVALATAFIDTWSWDTMAEKSFINIVEQGADRFNRETVDLILALKNIFGKCDLLAYLLFMTERIQEIWRVLKPTGSFYLHCDPTASHYLKLLLDSIFIPAGGKFRNEIIWRIGWVSGYKTKANKLIRNHDVILYYNKSKDFIFNKQYIPYAEDYVRRDGKKPTGEGIPLEDTWNCSEADVLNSIGIMSFSKEKLGYPTQKPTALLERIISLSSNEGDIVLDAFCGCGTTVDTAQKLNRKWIGIDITYNAIEVIISRMEHKYGTEINNELIFTGIPKDFNSAKALAEKKDDRLRKEFEKWAIITYTNNRAFVNDKKGGDGGIDGVKNILDKDTEGKQTYKKALYQVKSSKNLSPSVIRDLDSTVTNNNAVVGVLLTLYPMDNLKKEAKKYGTYKNNLLGKEYQRIQVIEIMDIIDKKNRCELPSESILKTAERVKQVEQSMF